MDDTLEQRWEKIKQTIETKRDLLQSQGCLVHKVHRAQKVWCLRFFEWQDGREVQRSLYIGSDTELIHRTRDLLEQIREDRVFARQTAWLIRLAASMQSLVRPVRRRATKLLRDGKNAAGIPPGGSLPAPTANFNC